MSQPAPLDAAEGLRWIGAGFSLIWRRPLLWLMLTTVLLAVALIGSMLPAVGSILLYLLSPALLATLLVVCHQLAGDAAPDLRWVQGTLAAASSGLLGLGLAYTAMQLGLLLLLGSAVPGLLDGLAPGRELPATATSTADALPMLLLVLALSIPATFLMWFAPALVVFRRMAPWPAMRYSLAACLFHWRACLVNGIAIFLLLLLASLPAMLGLLVWVPLTVASLYNSFVAIFGISADRGAPALNGVD